MDTIQLPQNLKLTQNIEDLLSNARSVTFATTIKELEEMACINKYTNSMTVSYELPNGKVVDEVDVVRVKNGISANYRETYMRRRDPNCMVIADNKPTDKTKYSDRFSTPFEELKGDTFDWLKNQDLAVFAFEMGPSGIAGDALAICPANAGFFALGLGLLQGIVDIDTLDRTFSPSAILYVAPPFRHTHFDGKQVVVHNRTDEHHEIFSYNLYPGPSAKKGIYGALIHRGEQEEWVTAHCSAVEVVTPYDNIVTFMHEGASGGGKSEMLQQPHRMHDGRLLLGKNLVTGEEECLEIARSCELHPVCDDMGVCHPELQENDGRLYIADAENAWFIRVDHITEYGTDPDLERLTIQPSQPLLFLNIDVSEGGTALIWNHIEDEPGVPCPNPRLVLPRDIVPNISQKKIGIDIRTFGLRNPPCTKSDPTYGIAGMMHILPPALAWLWRLVSPRGHANPSIVDVEGMSSEGVGSYWPFATGKKVTQANLLLKQFVDSSETRYALIPNQHIGAWKTGFMPQWLIRDYLARRGHARYSMDQIEDARCPLLGYTPKNIRIEGVSIPHEFLRVETQAEVGTEAYDIGAKILTEFFHAKIKEFLHPDLDPLGRKIIECCLANGSADDYRALINEADVK